MNFKTFITLFALSSSFAFAQGNLDEAKEKIPAVQEAVQDNLPDVPDESDVKDKASIIAQRIKSLQKRQAEYLANVASGKIKPNADLLEKWPQIQADVFSLRADISTLNNLASDDRRRPSVEAKLLSSLQQIGLYLVPADHPPFTARKLDKQQLAEMARIESAIENLDYGSEADRKNAKPVEVIGSAPIFTMLYLPVPLVLKSEPGEKIYLVATTGGTFSNGLSLIELETNEQGIAKTTWETIGDAVGTCDISIYSKSAIEREEFQIEVVAPSLAIFEGLPAPDKALLHGQQAFEKITPLKNRITK